MGARGSPVTSADPLFRLDVGVLCDLRVLREVRLHDLEELLGGAAERLQAHRRKALLYDPGIAHDAVDLGVESLDDRARRAGGAPPPPPDNPRAPLRRARSSPP